jgi:hypothetical protein
MLDIRRNSESSAIVIRNFSSPKIPDFLNNYKEKGREQNCELRIANCEFRSKKSGARIQNPGDKKIRSALQFWLLATDYWLLDVGSSKPHKMVMLAALVSFVRDCLVRYLMRSPESEPF